MTKTCNTNAQSKSLIDRDHSVVIKGVAILLVVIGHNTILPDVFPWMYNWIYYFHVQVFFFLPFLYGVDGKHILTWGGVKNKFIRIYYPFLLFYIGLTLLSYIIHTPKINSISGVTIHNFEYIFSCLTGNIYQLKYFCGITYLWFLPVFFSSSIFMIWYFQGYSSRTKGTNILIIAVCFVLYIIAHVFFYRQPYPVEFQYWLYSFSLFAIFQGVGFSFLGIIGRWLMEKTQNIISIRILTLILFTALSIAIFLSDYQDNEPYWILRAVMPFVGFYSVFIITNYLRRVSILKEIGNNSFLIYLIHQPLNVAVVGILARIELDKLSSLIISFVIVLALSYWFSKLVQNTWILRRFICPKSFAELVNK